MELHATIMLRPDKMIVAFWITFFIAFEILQGKDAMAEKDVIVKNRFSTVSV